MSEWTVVLVDVALEAVTGLRVGAGRSGEVTTDAPLLRTPDGVPVVPGSSLKGVLRSAAERLLKEATPPACDVLASPCQGQPRDRSLEPEELASLCAVCKLFGSPHAASRLFVDDLTVSGYQTMVRDGVAIDREELKVQGPRKYDYEVIAPGARLDGTLRVDDPQPGELALLENLFGLLDAGVIAIGGGSSRGLGRVRLAGPLRARQLVASRWRPGESGETWDIAEDRPALDRLFEGAVG